jgi:hypothetical protein
MKQQASAVLEFSFGTAELLEGIGVPVLITSPERVALWANEQFADLFGIVGGVEMLLGRDLPPIAERVSTQYRDPEAFLAGIRRATERAVPMSGEVLERVDGRVISRSFSPVRMGGELVAFVWRYDDVTEIHRQAIALEQSTTVLEAMERAHAPLVREATGREVFSALLDGLIDVTESAYGFVGEVHHDEHGPFLRSWAISDIAWDHATRTFFESAMRDKGFLEFRKSDSLYGVTLLTGEVVIANAPERDPRAGGLPEGHPPLVSYLGLPIMHHGRMVGMAGLAGRPAGYDDEMVARVQPLLSVCGSMIDAYAVDRERRTAELALRGALEVAEQANAAKTRLLGRVSHELRTPLNAVLGFAQLLAREVTDPRASRWVAQIDEAGHHVLAQVEDLLDLAAAESGRLEVELGPVDVDSLLGAVLRLASPLATERQVSTSLVPSGLRVTADADRLRVVLLNLVANAIKYNRPGGAVLLSSRVTDDHDVEITVADNGPGIPESQLEQAFVMFERLDAAGRGVPGAGLGLAIAREFTEAMHGSLSARAREGGGVEMVVSLRRDEREEQVMSSEPTAPWVLYVEDNEMNAELVSEYLTAFENTAVEIAPTLAAARQVLAERTPSLLLLDLNLPDGSGGDLATELLQGNQAPPIVLLTADAFSAHDLQTALPQLAGALVKPIRFEDLSAVVSPFVRG